MSETRPTPEQMLARLKTEGDDTSGKRRRGRLRIFFGYAAGVGKTYAMLQAAHKLQAEGTDVVVGYIELHARPQTLALLDGLECLPVQQVPYRGTTLREFDLDAALARKPQVILVDELAHTNAPGVRHSKRWQDVEELLSAGIDVYTTLNVQHVESLNDVVAQISGVSVRETIPDEVFARAEDVALIDLTPDELLERLREGQVYIPEQAARALQQFFRKPNLMALRELALRQAADRVHVDVEAARQGTMAAVPWPTSERLLVCVSPSPTSAEVIRATKRLADSLRAPWVAVHVQTPQEGRMSNVDRAQLLHHLRLSERLGGEVATLTGEDVAQETIAYARARNVTKIVIGKSDQPFPGLFARQSLVTRLLRDSGNVDVFVIRGVAEKTSLLAAPRQPRPWSRWLGMFLVLVLTTVVAWWFYAIEFAEANIVMAYLLGVIVVATRFGTGPAIVASFLSVLLFDVFFIRPFYTFAVHDSQYVITFAVMLLAALLTSTLTHRIRRLAEMARANEQRLESLYRLGRQLTGISGRRQLIQEAERAISEVFQVHAVLFLPDRERRIRPILDNLASFAASANEVAAAQWVFDQGQPAGLGTDTLPSLTALYLPLATPNGVVGVLSVQPTEAAALTSLETRQILDTYCTQIAFALERDRLTEEFQSARVQMETEKLRSSLLSAVSHDLRTPLAVIAGASSSLLQTADTLNGETRQELLESIFEEAHRMLRLVENLLQMTRLSSGVLTIHKEWQPVDEVIGSSIQRMHHFVKQRRIAVTIAPDTPLGHFDAVLIEEVLLNLLDNAHKYSPADKPIEIRASGQHNNLVIEVTDRGRGLSATDQLHLFEKFYRGSSKADRCGAGLGLAICKAIINAHGGTISADNRPEGGTVFRFLLPATGKPPQIPVEEEIESTKV